MGGGPSTKRHSCLYYFLYWLKYECQNNARKQNVKSIYFVTSLDVYFIPAMKMKTYESCSQYNHIHVD